MSKDNIRGLSIIIPCYNESRQIVDNIMLVKEFLINNDIGNYEIIVVTEPLLLMMAVHQQRQSLLYMK